jgi:hypothetical protein
MRPLPLVEVEIHLRKTCDVPAWTIDHPGRADRQPMGLISEHEGEGMGSASYSDASRQRSWTQCSRSCRN